MRREGKEGVHTISEEEERRKEQGGSAGLIRRVEVHTISRKKWRRQGEGEGRGEKVLYGFIMDREGREKDEEEEIEGRGRSAGLIKREEVHIINRERGRGRRKERGGEGRSCTVL